MDEIRKIKTEPLGGYSIRVSKIESKLGYWNKNRVEVLKDGEYIGEYIRNYDAMYNTFHPFKQRIGTEIKEYALISDDYTRTAVLSLPDCNIIAAEEANAYGFCPVDFFVPYEDPYQWLENGKIIGDYEGIPGTFGFVAGCHWGDDSSWKIQYLDLSRLAEGVIVRKDKFGYISLPRGMSLKDAINMEFYTRGTYLGVSYDETFIEIATMQTYRL